MRSRQLLELEIRASSDFSSGHQREPAPRRQAEFYGSPTRRFIRQWPCLDAQRTLAQDIATLRGLIDQLLDEEPPA